MTTKPRRLSKRQVGSVICDGAPLTVIDESAITPKRIEVTCDCGCQRKRVIDVTPAVRTAIEEAARGAMDLPAGDYQALVVFGHAGTFLSGVLRKL